MRPDPLSPPSEAAQDAHDKKWALGHCLEAAHDPDLGVLRSVNLRDVILFVRDEATCIGDDQGRQLEQELAAFFTEEPSALRQEQDRG